MAIDDLSWICNWYLSQCDDDWEHSFGVIIRNLDNPGWMVEINLDGTELEESDFQKVEFGQGTRDVEEWRLTGSWWVVSVKDKTFSAFCGPLDLPVVLKTFRNWAEATS